MQKALIFNNIEAFYFSSGSPGNPEYSGELTTHGLIPNPRDCSNQLQAPQVRLELTTHGLTVHCSNQLSY